MNKTITILIIATFLTMSNLTFASELPTIKDRVQQQLSTPNEQSVDDSDILSCEENLEKYRRKVLKYLQFEHPTALQQWRLDYYRGRLAHWLRSCE